MSGILLSSATRTNLFALQDIASSIRLTQNRLATGKKVNTAFDSPAAFFTASALMSRAASLNTILDSVGLAVKTVEAADKGITSIRALVASAQTLATQALASPDTLAKFTGTLTGQTTATTLTGIATGKTITVSDGTNTAIYTDAAGNDIQDFLDAVNNTANLNVTASLNASGAIELKAKSTNSITIGGTATTGELASIGLVAGTTNFTANATRQSLAAQFDSIRTQIDQMVGDASFNGTNLLQGNTLNVVFNETGSSKVTVSGASLSAQNLGVTAVTTGGGLNFQTDGEINTAITQLATATKTLETHASTFASNVSVVKAREDFTKSLVDTLQSGADDLVLADTNEEAANLLALQTRQQIATTSLALTQDSEERILRLFGG